MTKRDENSLLGKCKDPRERSWFPSWSLKLSPARQGVGPSWRARSEEEILLSLETKELLCVNGIWVGKGEVVNGNEKEFYRRIQSKTDRDRAGK